MHRVPLLPIAIALFVVVVSAASWLRTLGLYTSTWDLGIYQQALWTAGHGRPFYEAPDWETGGFGSFLEVHSAFILYLVVPLYNAVPSAGTLFVLQSTVVGLAAIPLYGMVRAAGGSRDRALAVALLYLVSAPVISASLYDFHIESFLPVEIFGLFYCWQRGHYAIGGLVAFAAAATMETAPVFTGAVGLYFWIEALLGVPRAEGSVPSADASGWRAWVRRWTQRTTSFGALASIGLVVGSVLAYYLLLALRTGLLASHFGFPMFPSGESGYVIGGSPQALGLSLANLKVGLIPKVGYWLLVFAFVLFLPIRAPRALVVAAPWIAFTFLSANVNYVTLGYQYGFLASAGVFPSVALGAAAWNPPVLALPAPIERTPPRRWRGNTARVGTLVVVAVAVVGLNLALTPMDPLLQGGPLGSGYQLSYQVGSAYSEIRSLVGVIPPAASVLASDFLFPFVANDPHAYSLFTQRNPSLELPFNVTAPPQYVLLAESRLGAVPDWLTLELYNQSEFGLRGAVWATPVGVVTLFEAGFNGSSFALGPAPTGNQTVGPADLARSPISWLVANVSLPGGVALESTPFASGQLWSSAPLDLPAGCFNFTFWVRAWPMMGVPPPRGDSAVLGLEGNPFSETGWFSDDLNFSTVGQPGYVPVSFEQRTSEPVFSLVLRGYALTWQAGVGVSSIHITDESCAPPVPVVPGPAPA